ncbi:VWA domain-containing protein [Thermaerobacter litoralis]
MMDLLRHLRPQETLSLEHVRFDRTLFEERLAESARLQALLEAGAEYPAWRDLVEDVFLSLYKVDPRQRPAEAMRPSHRPNHELVRMTMETPAHRDARAYSIQDELLSAAGVLQFGETLLEQIRQRQELDQLFRQAGAGEADGGPDGDSGGGSGEDGTEAGDGVDPGTAEALAQALKRHSQALRQAARAAASAAAQTAEDAAEALAAWGFDRGMLRHLPLEKQLDLVERLLKNPDLRQISRMLGAIRSLLRGLHRTRTYRVPDTLYGIEFGGDLERVLPQEMALLGDPALRPLFMGRLLDRSLMQYRLRARPKGGMGPFVMCLDASGSTAGAVQAWIKAIALALAQLAREQRRDFAGIVFGAEGELVSVEVPAGLKAAEYVERVVELGTAYFGGGTDFDAPLAKALELIEGVEGLRRADILFVTDGYCAVRDETAARIAQARETAGLRLWGVLIGNVDPSSLAPVADRVLAVSNPGLEAAEAVFEAVLSR